MVPSILVVSGSYFPVCKWSSLWILLVKEKITVSGNCRAPEMYLITQMPFFGPGVTFFWLEIIRSLLLEDKMIWWVRTKLYWSHLLSCRSLVQSCYNFDSWKYMRTLSKKKSTIIVFSFMNSYFQNIKISRSLCTNLIQNLIICPGLF